MPKLTLVPDIREQTREEIEAYLEHVRAKRMVAAVEFYTNKNEKIGHEADKVGRQMLRQKEMLGKELQRLDSALAKVEYRMQTIEAMQQTIGNLTEQMTVNTVGEDEEDDDE